MANLIDLESIATPYGFVDCASCEAAPVDETGRRRYLDYLSLGFNASMGYLERNTDKRLDPTLLVDGCLSVLCFLAPYGCKGGRVASFAHGMDYHKVVKDRLFSIMSDLKDIEPSFIGRPFVDSAPILERYWAARAGLGFIGLNNFLISPRYGLRTIIGVILCNIPSGRFKSHPLPLQKDCGRCGRCISECPGGALEEHLLDAGKCISYHTIESKEHSTINLCGQVFGCEKCIEACPWNKDIEGWSEFETNSECINEEDWQNMTPDRFKEKYGDSALFRTGLEKIQDNAKGQDRSEHHPAQRQNHTK